MIKNIFFLCILVCAQSIFAQDKNPLPAPATLITASSSDNQIKVSWNLPEDKSIVSVELYRKTYELPMQSSKNPGPGELIASLAASQTSYVDTKVASHKRYYYRVVLLNESSQKSNPSFPAIASVKDLTPPSSVASVTTKVIDSSHLNLRWTASESDDVVSYRIYRARDKSSAVIVKTIALNKKGERFFNTILKQKKNLQIDYLYAVAAVDAAGNISRLSDFSMLRLPDSIPPLNPLQLTIKQNDGMLELNWLPGSENDLAGYRIYRQQGDDTKSQLLKPFKPLHKGLIKVPQYIDVQIESLSSYRYRVAAVDNFGNESKASRGVAVRTLQFSKTIPAPSSLVLITDKKGYPKLNWQLENKLSGIKLRVFRSDGGEFQAVSSLLDKNQFTDNSVIGGRAYKYQIKSVSDVGLNSAGSNVVMWTGSGK